MTQTLKTIPKGIKPQFHPMPGKIAVKLINEEVVGNLWLPTSAGQRVMGQVVALGDDEAEGDDYQLAVGCVVLFGQNSGITVRVEREEVRILRTTEILCRVTWNEDNVDGKAQP